MRLPLLLAACLLLSACNDDGAGPPPKKHDDLSRAIHKPLDKAKSVETTAQEQADAQRKALDAMEGGGEPTPATPPSQ